MKLADLAHATQIANRLDSRRRQLEYMTRDDIEPTARVHCLQADEELATAALEAGAAILNLRIIAAQGELRELGIDPE